MPITACDRANAASASENTSCTRGNGATATIGQALASPSARLKIEAIEAVATLELHDLTDEVFERTLDYLKQWYQVGDLVAFAFPPYQFDAATPGTLVARSAFFGQHGYVPDVQDLASNTNMRATFIAGGKGIAKGTVVARTIDLAPTLLERAGIALPQGLQGRSFLPAVKGHASSPTRFFGS